MCIRDRAVDVAVDEIKRLANSVDSSESIAQVASVSAADEEIGGLIAEAMEKVGKDLSLIHILIGCAAYYRYMAGERDDLTLDAIPNLEL